MPTLVWIRRPKSGAGDTGGDSARKAAAAAVPDAAPVISTSAGHAVPPGGPLPAVSSGGKKRKRKRNCAKAATAVKKKSKVASERDLPRVFYKTPTGKLASQTMWAGKRRYIGTFDTPEQASAAYMSVKKDLADAKRSAFGADEVDDAFDEAKKKALESVGVSKKKRLPKGVQKTTAGKFKDMVYWGGKSRYIGTFDTPEQASAAYMSVKKDRDDANLSGLGADEVNAAFDEAIKKAVDAVGASTRKIRPSKGFYKTPTGKLASQIMLGGKQRHIGTFDTPEQASAAYLLVRNDLDDGKLSGLGADEVAALFDAAQKKALKAAGGFVPTKKTSKATLKRASQSVQRPLYTA